MTNTPLKESAISRAGDLYYAYRFIRLLTTDWKDTKAFEFGIVDKNGVLLKKAKDLKTSDEKAAYTPFHRLVYNLKRLLQKTPVGKSKLVSYATALFLLREETQMSYHELIKCINQSKQANIRLPKGSYLSENHKPDLKDILEAGTYTLSSDILCSKSYEVIARKGTHISISEDCTKPIDYITEDIGIYKGQHIQTKVFVNFSKNDIGLL